MIELIKHMEFDKELSKEILELSKDIKRESLLSTGNKTYFKFSIFPDDMTIENTTDSQRVGARVNKKRKILFKLADMGVLEVKKDEEEFMDGYDSSFLVKLNHKNFEELYENLSDKTQSTSEKNENKIHIFYDDVGNFWLEPKKVLCYSMGAKSDRYKILRYLVDNKGYQDTTSISGFLGTKSDQSVRTEIGKIKMNITKYLKIDGEEIIESKKDSGYRINPAFKIVKV